MTQMTTTPIKYRKLRADPHTRMRLNEADPETGIRLLFEVRKTEEELAEWEEVTNIFTKINLGDTMLVTATTTVGMLEVFEEDDSVILYDAQALQLRPV
jgi:hypothetical protein